MASNLRRSKRTIGRRLSYIETKLNVSRRSNIPRRLAPGAVTGPSLSPDVNSTLSTIQTTADGKNSIYRQTTQPTGGSYVEGDLWFDTDDGNKFYRYTSGVWTGFTLGNSALASISANKITAGSLDASVIVTSNLDAGQITAGALNSIEIRGGAPVGGVYPFRVTTAGDMTSTSGKIGAFSIGSEALTASTFATWPFDTTGSLNIGVNGQIVGTVNVGSFYGTAYSTTVTVNANNGEGIIVSGNASGSTLQSKITSSFITTNQLFIAAGDVQTLLNGKSNSGHNHDSTYSGTSHTHAYIPVGGITQSTDIALENTNTGSNEIGQVLQLRRRFSANGDNFIQFYRTAGGTGAGSVGAIQFANATTLELANASDARLKTDVIDGQGGIDLISRIRPVNFKWKNDDSNEVSYGFIAQELYEVFPNAVSVGGDDPAEQPWMVRLATLIPITVLAIKEMLTRIEELEAKVNSLS